MKSLFKKIIGGHKHDLPARITATLASAFHDISSIEWTFREHFYEAVFYRNNIEHIARIDRSGKLFEYRINQPFDQIPEAVKACAEIHGEIMNCISIHPGKDKPVYEIIVRDIKKERSVLMVSGTGVMISKLKL